jgi:hypothetical protein
MALKKLSTKDMTSGNIKPPASSKITIASINTNKEINSVSKKLSNPSVTNNTVDSQTSFVTEKIKNEKTLAGVNKEDYAPGNGATVTITKTKELPVIEKILSPVDANVDKTSVTTKNIEQKYFNFTETEDRKTTATVLVFNFDYLSYLFFEVDIYEELQSFYDAVDYIIDKRLFERSEDDGVVAPENVLDEETMHLIFNQI